MEIVIERATDADVDTYVSVQIAAFHDDARLYPGLPLDGPPGYDSVEEVLAKFHATDCYKILHDGRLVGGIVVYDQGEGEFLLDVLFVDPEYHNRGIGSLAMEFIERTYPATKWILDTPDYAIRNQHFYEKFGFVKVGVRELHDITLFAYEKLIQR